MKISNSDRRKFRRELLKTPIKISKPGDNVCYNTITKDLSEGGIRFSTQKFYPNASRLKLELFTGTQNNRYIIFGNIKWIRKLPYGTYYDVGVSFENPEKCIKSSINFQTIEQFLQNQPTEPYKLSI